MNRPFAWLLFLVALPCAAQPATPSATQPATTQGVAAATPPTRGGEPEVRHTVIEGAATRIDELRVRGVARRIVVTTKGGAAPRYEIITGDGSRDLSDGANTSRGATGKRVWRVLDF